MHSIRFKITAIAIAEILTAILCVFFVSLSILQTENDTKSVEMMDLLAQDTKKSLEQYTSGIEQSVETVSNLAIDGLDSTMLVQGGVVGSGSAKDARTPEQVAQLDAYLADYTNRIQSVFSPVAEHQHGVATYYYCIVPEISENEHGFYYSRMGKTGFDKMEPIDASKLDQNDEDHNMWYTTAIQRGRPSWIGPYEALTLDDAQLCSYIMPIYKSGTLVGLLGMDISLDTLVSLVSSIRVYDTGFACLWDANGNILYHPRMEAGSVPDFPVTEQLLQQESSDGELIRYTIDGEERQLSFTTLSNGMKLGIVAPTSEINASSIRLAWIVPFITAALIIVFVILTMVLIRYITKPLQQLTEASKRLAAADYDVKLNYKGNDEVGELTSSFQSMSDQMQVYIGDLNRKVLTDDLTGLPNQRHFFELAVQERDRLVGEGKHAVMLYFNLVGMKHFNRQLGFDEGDRLIRAVAQILAKHFGEMRTSRFGQDHFAAVTDDDNLENRLRDVFADCAVANDGKTLPVSVGIYENDLEDVAISVACDRAKYACDTRRGTFFSGFRYFDASMIKQVELLRYVINHLDQALEEKWVQVYYQPIVRAVNRRVCDEEALSRWVDPERGMLPPGDFIPALEDSGLIYKLDLYVLDEILSKMLLQEEAGFNVVPHSVNLSRSDFEACDIVNEICRRVDAAGIDRDMITIEITESIIGSDFEFMKGQVERFRSLGFPVWMDDFGSGYSSLDYLQSIKFDLIKFDMSFLRKLDDSESGKIILTELMQMATALGVDTICEGVETETQLRFLQDIGCSKLQGYYFCKPIPLSAIIERYEKGEQIGYEDPEESAYYEAIGKANLYDLTTVAQDDDNSLQNIFNTLPMGILEVSEDAAEFVRTNQSCRDFISFYFGPEREGASDDADGESVRKPVTAEDYFVTYARSCAEKGAHYIFSEKMPDGSLMSFIIKWIGSNKVTGKSAVAIAILSIVGQEEGTTYANIARALASDYYKIYYVDLATNHFIEYSSTVGKDEMAFERHGDDFFVAMRNTAMKRIHKDDREVFLKEFTKENIIEKLERHQGVFTSIYDLDNGGVPVSARMKVTQLESGGRYVVIGISIKDDQ